MGIYKKADFYYGAFLSVLVNNGICPALIEKDGDLHRRRFRITTNNGEYEIYCKYKSDPTGNTDPNWAFTFQPREVKELHSLLADNKKVVFAFICVQKELTSPKQELALVEKNEFIKCVELNTYKDSAPRLSVKAIKSSNYLRIYGNKLSDKIGKEDSTIRIKRNRVSIL